MELAPTRHGSFQSATSTLSSQLPKSFPVLRYANGNFDERQLGPLLWENRVAAAEAVEQHNR